MDEQSAHFSTTATSPLTQTGHQLADLQVALAHEREISAARLDTIKYWRGQVAEKDAEIERLRELLTDAYPYVEEMVWIDPAARATRADIDLYFEKTEMRLKKGER